MYGHLESLSVLLHHKATINCRPNGKAAIHVACEMANVECLKILCNHGAKLNCFSMSGQAPLHFCTTRTSMPCAQQLLWRGKVKLSSTSRATDKDGGHGLGFHLGGNFSKYMCICPFHPQVMHVFISDSLSSSLWSEEVFPILFPHLIYLSLATGPCYKIFFHFSASSPLSNQSISSRAPPNQGLPVSLRFFSCLFHLGLLLSYFHMKGHLSSSFLFKFPGPE